MRRAQTMLSAILVIASVAAAGNGAKPKAAGRPAGPLDPASVWKLVEMLNRRQQLAGNLPKTYEQMRRDIKTDKSDPAPPRRDMQALGEQIRRSGIGKDVKLSVGKGGLRLTGPADQLGHAGKQIITKDVSFVDQAYLNEVMAAYRRAKAGPAARSKRGPTSQPVAKAAKAPAEKPASGKPTASRRKAAAIRTRSKSTSPADYQLSCVLVGHAGSQAILNGRRVRVGDRVDGAEVLAIQPRRVRLKVLATGKTLSVGL